jgi:hypothetical protein
MDARLYSICLASIGGARAYQQFWEGPRVATATRAHDVLM